jgi:hypothetical protein
MNEETDYIRNKFKKELKFDNDIIYFHYYYKSGKKIYIKQIYDITKGILQTPYF